MTAKSAPFYDPGQLFLRLLTIVWDYLKTYAGLVWLWLLGITVTTVTGINLMVVRLPAQQLLTLALWAFVITGIILKSKTRLWLAIPAVLVLGLAYILLFWADLVTPLGRILFDLASLTGPAIQKTLTPEAVLNLQDDMLNGNRALVITGLRVRNWLSLTGKGVTSISDPLVLQMVWGLAIWLAVSFLNWATWRLGQAILAIVPLGVLLSVGVFFTGLGYSHLAGFLTFTLMLQTSLSGFHRLNVWEAQKLDYATDLFMDLNAFILPFIGLIVGLAILMPSLSIQKIADTLYDLLNVNTKEVNQVASSFGLNYRGNDPNSRKPEGLPQSHLLNGNPDLGKNLVMTVKTGEFPAMPYQALEQIDLPRYYWQGTIYSRYNLYGWELTGSEGGTLKAYEPLGVATGPGRRLTQFVTRHIFTDDLLYTAGIPLLVDHDAAVTYGVDGLVGARLTAKSFSAESWITDNGPILLRAGDINYPEAIKKTYLQLPARLPDRVRNLALELTAAEPTPFDKAVAIETYLRANYPYTLNVPQPPASRDVADYFLFELKKGYCDYYATSMVVLARAAGIPARFITGYAPGEYDSVRAEYRIIQADAHSWAQIYFPNAGWIDFEPTAGKPAIVRVDRNSVMPPAPENPVETPPEPDKPLTILGVHPFWWAVGILGAGWLVYQIQLWRLRRLPAKALGQAIYSRLLGLAGRTGFAPVAGETPYEFASRFPPYLRQKLAHTPFYRAETAPQLPQVQTLTDIFVRQLYAPPQTVSVHPMTIIRAWYALRAKLWQALVLLWLAEHLAFFSRKPSRFPATKETLP